MDSESSEASPAAEASIIHLANVSAQYGSSIFAESDVSFAMATTTSNATGIMTGSLNGTADIGNESSPVASSIHTNEKSKKKSCPKQHQLPMFLSSELRRLVGAVELAWFPSCTHLYFLD